MRALHATSGRVAVALLLLLVVAGWAAPASAANIVVVNVDPAGAGLNDPTPVAPIGGNPATTLGGQRLFVYLYAANLWGSVLDSAVDIRVRASFVPQTCTATSGTLGAAGATYVIRDFTGALEAATWYHPALANALAGTDLVPGTDDVNSFFNSRIGTDPACLTGRGWYYGIDHNEGVNFDFLAVVMHEIGHGIGFSNFVNETTGSFNGGFTDVYANRTYDVTTGETWQQMTQAERQASAINDRNVVWIGDAVTAQAPGALGPRPSLLVLTPSALKGSYDVQTASFGAPVGGGGGVTGKLAIADDGVGATADACEPLVNDVEDKIVLADRGVCTFVIKVANAQAAGAKGVVIANNVATGLPGMGGADPAITIPSVGISQALGNALRAAIHPSVTVKIALDPSFQAGTQNGFVRLYAPNPVQSGSSGSHWDVSAFPNLLMEPAITSSLAPSVNLDLTPALLEDIGWTLLPP